MKEWISVDDRLPADKQNEVIVCRYGEVHTCYFDKYKKSFYFSWNPYARIYENFAESVTHWMPLPDPPEEV